MRRPVVRGMHRRHHRAWLASAILAGWTTACIDPHPVPKTQPDDTSSAPDSTASDSSESATTTSIWPDPKEPLCALTPTTDSFASWIEQSCERMFSCCDRLELTDLVGAQAMDVAGCRSSLTAALLSPDFSQADAARFGHFDPELGKALYLTSTNVTEVRSGCLTQCIAHKNSQGCSRPDAGSHCVTPDNYPGGPCDLNLLLRGTLPQNEVCDPTVAQAGLDIQCQYGMDCLPHSDGVFRCARVGIQGSACELTPNSLQGSCEHDLVCHPQTKICVLGAKVGQSCDHEGTASFVGCMAGLVCGTDSRCVPECQGGARCINENGQSDDRLCPVQLSCFPGTVPSCQARNDASLGCDSDGDCGADQYCNSADTDSPVGSLNPGTCAARSLDGACTRDQACTADRYCGADQRCQPKLQEGQACSNSASCNNSVCAAMDQLSDGSDRPLTPVCGPTSRASTTCRIKDPGLMDAMEFAAWLTPQALRVQHADAPWVSICTDGGCERSDTDPSNVTGRCVAYAKLDESCDHRPGQGAPSCAPGQHCVVGRCTAFLERGDACVVESETWDTSDPAYIDGFHLQLCDPSETRCVQDATGGVCRRDAERLAPLCDGP